MTGKPRNPSDVPEDQPIEMPPPEETPVETVPEEDNPDDEERVDPNTYPDPDNPVRSP